MFVTTVDATCDWLNQLNYKIIDFYLTKANAKPTYINELKRINLDW